jgi:hypothetical protein
MQMRRQTSGYARTHGKQLPTPTMSVYRPSLAECRVHSIKDRPKDLRPPYSLQKLRSALAS